MNQLQANKDKIKKTNDILNDFVNLRLKEDNAISIDSVIIIFKKYFLLTVGVFSLLWATWDPINNIISIFYFFILPFNGLPAVISIVLREVFYHNFFALLFRMALLLFYPFVFFKIFRPKKTSIFLFIVINLLTFFLFTLYFISNIF